MAHQLGFSDDLLPQDFDDDDDAARAEVLRKRQAEVYSILILHLEGDAFRCARKAKEGDGAGAWTRLTEKYASSNGARKTTLQRKLFNMPQLSDAVDIESALNDMDDLRVQLEQIGVDIKFQKNCQLGM